MSSKETTTPLERSLKKMDVLMRSFGMRTRIFKGSTRAIVKGTRKVYPYELNATLVETARGVGIRIRMEKMWFSFLKLIPFFIILLFSILQYLVPEVGNSIASATGINLFHAMLGPNPNVIGLWIVLPILGFIIVGSEILERIIRVRYIQDRMPRFLSGAEWNIAEPPMVLDILSSSNNLLWIMYTILIVIFAPMTFSAWIFEKFLEVYQVGASDLLKTTSLMSVLDIAIFAGMMFAVLYMNYEKFRGGLDRQQVRRDIKLESDTRQLLQVASGATMLATIMFSVFYFTFWTNISIINIIIFYVVMIASSVLGVWLFWQKENYIFIALTIWLFLTDVIMIFLNSNNPSYSWMIICHLFLILFVIVFSLNKYFEKYLAEKGIYEPSWFFNLLPLFSYIAVFTRKKARVTRGVEKDLEEILDEEMKDKVKEKLPLVLDMKKIKDKGKEAEKIIKNYQKVISKIVKGEMNILSIIHVNSQILDLIKENKKLHKDAKKFLSTVDSLLWDDGYALKDGDKILQISNEVYDEVLKKG
ncbi:MAG: hypothetical protein ACXABK_01350 [Candidatus Heimdallarchaeaceae archaeon]|jgi:hypothetical protein